MSRHPESESRQPLEVLRKEYQHLNVLLNLKTLENRPFVSELMKQLEGESSPRYLVVMGLPGSGKTTTALQASRFMTDYYSGEVFVKQFDFDFYRKFMMIRHGSTATWKRNKEWLELNHVMLKDIQRYIEISNHYYTEIAKLTHGSKGMIGIPMIEVPGIGETADRGETMIRALHERDPGKVMVIVVVGQDGLIEHSVNVRNYVQNNPGNLQQLLLERFRINVAPRPGDMVSDEIIKETFDSMAPEQFLRSIPEELDRLTGSVPIDELASLTMSKNARVLHGLTSVEKGQQATRIAYYRWLLQSWGIPDHMSHIVVNRFNSKRIYYPIHTPSTKR